MVEMKYTKFVISEAKRKIFGDPKPTAVKIPIYVKKQIKTDSIKVETQNYDSGPSFGGISSIVGIAVAGIVFLMVLTIYGSIASSLNTSVLGSTSSSLINLIPLVLVGAAIIGVITMAFRLST